MWVMTTGGFLSAVSHRDNPALLVVRGRVKADVLALAEFALEVERDERTEGTADAALITYEQSDYPWRVIVLSDTFARFVWEAAQSIDYGNFKAAVGLFSPEHARAYGRVWSDLLDLERTDPDTPRRPALDDLLWPTGDDEPDDEHAAWWSSLLEAQDEPEPEPQDRSTAYDLTLACGCLIDLATERMVDPCPSHTPPPF